MSCESLIVAWLCHERVGDFALSAALISFRLLAFDFAESLFVLGYVVAQGKEEFLGVLGGHYDAAMHFRLWHVGSYGYEIKEEFIAGV